MYSWGIIALSKELSRIESKHNLMIHHFSSSRYIELYNGILTSINPQRFLTKYKSDNCLSNTYFSSLKSRYKDKVISCLASIENKPLSRNTLQERKLFVIQCYGLSQYYTASGNKQLSVEILEYTVRILDNYDFPEIKLAALKDLVFQYGLFVRDDKKFELYNSKLKNTLRLINQMSEIEECYIFIGDTILRNINPPFDKQLLEVEKRVEEIKSSDNVDSYYFKYYFYDSLYYINLIKREFKTRLKIIIEAISYFKNKLNFSTVGIYTFEVKLGLLYMEDGDYRKAIIQFESTKKYLTNKKRISWHNINNYIILGYFALQEYDKAYEVFSDVIKSDNLKYLSLRFREPWYIKEAFIHFLIRTGRIDPDKHPEVKLRSFRISRFVNEVTVYSKDKKGINITINIIQILFLIADKKYDAVADKLSSLKQYSYRYLRKPEYIRPSNFIKMLQTISTCHFKKSRVIQKADRHLDVLKQNPMDYTEQALSIEIIPYERLWEEVLNLLE